MSAILEANAYEIAEHVSAIVIWWTSYMKHHNLRFTEGDNVGNLDFHLRHIDTLLRQMEHPLWRNPILSDAGYQQEKQSSSDDKETEPLAAAINSTMSYRLSQVCCKNLGWGPFLSIPIKNMRVHVFADAS